MRVTLQLYTVRDQLSQDLEGTLAKVKAIGLEYVELAGAFGRSASEWRSLLDGLGLKASGSHVGLDLLSSDLDSVIADARTLGFEFVIVPWVSKDRVAGKWAEFGKELEGYGRKLSQAGLQLAYHNHAFEFEGGGFEKLYEASDPALVKAEIDVAWVQIGGDDPAAWITRLSGRVPLIHAKDYDPDKQPQWTPAGQGRVDFDAVLAAARGAGVQFAGIELDESPIDPLEAVKQSYEFFASRGLS